MHTKERLRLQWFAKVSREVGGLMLSIDIAGMDDMQISVFSCSCMRRIRTRVST